MFSVLDQLGRHVELTALPQRIISLVPSQTELLYDLGLEGAIAGITKFCIHPSTKTRHQLKVGGTKQLDIDLIRSLKPDLIIANKEENERSQILQLAAEFPTYISDPNDLPSALQMIADIGELTGRRPEADALITAIGEGFSALPPIYPNLRVVYLIWRKPYMVAGQGTFINDMLKRCGLENVLPTDRYPEVSLQDIKAQDPDLILLSSEPYPFQQKHIAEFVAEMPKVRVELVNGEMFSWYGSRLLMAAEYFISLTDRLKRSY